MNTMQSRIGVLTTGLTLFALAGCSGSGASSDLGVSEEADTYSAADVCPAGVPAAIAPAADQTIKGKYNAVGVQVYMCNGAAAGPTWTFVAPQANLSHDNGRLLATHFIGPTWQGNDGSSVVGSKVAGATVDATAIPWLLLTAKSHADEDGFFQDVTSVQRLATVGGLAPTTGCDADHLGTIVQVPYSAEYVFYKTKAKGRIVQCSGS
jgi:hypothetical protein